jgi:hypothetical protein
MQFILLALSSTIKPMLQLHQFGALHSQNDHPWKGRRMTQLWWPQQTFLYAHETNDGEKTLKRAGVKWLVALLITCTANYCSLYPSVR